MQENEKVYDLPITIHSSYKLIIHILLAVVLLLCVRVIVLIKNDLAVLPLIIFIAAIIVFVTYAWFYIGILKKVYLELNEEGLRLKNIFSTKKMRWTDLAYVEVYSKSHSKFIGLVSKQKAKKQKDNFINFLSMFYGGNLSLSIPINLFSSMDFDTLYNTLIDRMRIEQEKNGENAIQESSTDEEIQYQLENRNTTVALLYALLVSVVVGTLYGISLQLFNLNIIFIPILGWLGILFVYTKKYNRDTAAIVTNILLGFIMALPFLLAPFIELILYNQDYLNTYGIFETMRSCAVLMAKTPADYMLYYIFAVCFFYIGFSFGRPMNLKNIIKKLFKKNLPIE